MLTTDELTFSKAGFARALGVSIRTLERLRADRVVPPSIAGLSHPRWSREVVLKWLRESGETRTK